MIGFEEIDDGSGNNMLLWLPESSIGVTGVNSEEPATLLPDTSDDLEEKPDDLDLACPRNGAGEFCDLLAFARGVSGLWRTAGSVTSGGRIPCIIVESLPISGGTILGNGGPRPGTLFWYGELSATGRPLATPSFARAILGAL